MFIYSEYSFSSKYDIITRGGKFDGIYILRYFTKEEIKYNIITNVDFFGDIFHLFASKLLNFVKNYQYFKFDIEFCITGGMLYLLQIRPLTNDFKLPNFYISQKEFNLFYENINLFRKEMINLNKRLGLRNLKIIERQGDFYFDSVELVKYIDDIIKKLLSKNSKFFSNFFNIFVDEINKLKGFVSQLKTKKISFIQIIKNLIDFSNFYYSYDFIHRLILTIPESNSKFTNYKPKIKIGEYLNINKINLPNDKAWSHIIVLKNIIVYNLQHVFGKIAGELIYKFNLKFLDQKPITKIAFLGKPVPTIKDLQIYFKNYYKDKNKNNKNQFEENYIINRSFLEGIIIVHKNYKGKVRIINKPTDFIQEDEIMIAKETNIHMLSLMLKAKAVLTEEGGYTSHAAIVCRELNKPCIVGVRGLTKFLKTGDRIMVRNGRIYKIS